MNSDTNLDSNMDPTVNAHDSVLNVDRDANSDVELNDKVDEVRSVWLCIQWFM